MDKLLMAEGDADDLNAPFRVSGRNDFALRVGLTTGAAALVPLGLALVFDRQMGWGSLVYSLVMGGLGALMFSVGLRGLEISADAEGIRWRYAFTSEFYA